MTEPDSSSGEPGEIERRLAAIISRFPDRFTDDQIRKIRERVERSLTLGKTLRSVHLPNGVGPGLDTRAMADE